LGTTYGGNGQTNFGLPDLRGRVSMHRNNHVQGERSGEENHTLISSEMPQHTHLANCNNTAGNQPSPAGQFWAQDSAGNVIYRDSAGPVMAPAAIGPAGGNQPHNNLAPFLVLNLCICILGVFPSRN
jgi:microcystin-dependent protein